MAIPKAPNFIKKIVVEVLLQRTQASTVERFFELFFRRFAAR